MLTKRVGKSKDDFNENDMQQDKFQKAANVIDQNQEQESSDNAGPSTPKNVSQFAATPC